MTMNFSPVQGATTPKPFNNLGMDLTVPPSIPVGVPTIEPQKADSFAPASTPAAKDIVPEEKAEGKGPVRGAKDFIRAVKKLGINISEYSKGTVTGIIQSLAVGGGIFAAGSMYKGIKQLFKHPSKMPVKALAVIGAFTTMAYNYWKVSLDANQKKADVDHRYTTTPVLDKK